jgi:hypothetical protein
MNPYFQSDFPGATARALWERKPVRRDAWETPRHTDSFFLANSFCGVSQFCSELHMNS